MSDSIALCTSTYDWAASGTCDVCAEYLQRTYRVCFTWLNAICTNEMIVTCNDLPCNSGSPHLSLAHETEASTSSAASDCGNSWKFVLAPEAFVE